MPGKAFIIGLMFMILCIQLGQSLTCYAHGFCLGGGCQNIVNTTKVCEKGQSHCWKLTIPSKGTQRGCGNNECRVTIDAGAIEIANVCCSKDYCNSAVRFSTVTGVILLLSSIPLINRLY